jgi:flagellar basal-body rod protein FlgF
MAGGYYTALSGMHTRMEALDRLAADIANTSTTGYTTERSSTAQADRPSFGETLQSAVDVVNGGPKLDFRPGAISPTGRSLDVAIEGQGFFAVQTPQGERYTRNGHLVSGLDGTLTTEDGDTVLGLTGPIKVGAGTVDIDADGTVRSGTGIAGTLKIVEFADPTTLARDGGSRFHTAAQPIAVAKPTLRSGSLEQSNVSVVDRIAELTEVTRSYETLLKAVSVLMNDVDRGAITELGRR